MAALATLDAPVVVVAWDHNDVHPIAVAEEVFSTAVHGRLRLLHTAVDGDDPHAPFMAVRAELAAVLRRRLGCGD